ncbi:LysR family transcriptional regulator [Acidimangrovimonas sediminis]|uniref:LysR family transcriptional regulator n=1 Tax=Acidimangrovimonas sediminis TaxID=2056283 RepID=UPI000C804A4D|nr:LysR family transcriptional regulator [Acidimangrovimonas sediminis]
MILQRRMLPDMRLLQTFESAARHGNFTRAGEELSLTQSAVSRQIRELEDQLGKRLFERVRGRVVVTQAGGALLPEVQRLMAMAESTMRHAGAGAQGDGVLAINVLPTFATRWLMPRLPAFSARHPEARFDLSTRREVFDFAETQCDMAIHYGKPIWPGATCTYLCSEIIVPVAGGALRDRPVGGAAALASAPKVHLTERPRLWPEWFQRLGLDLADPNAGHWFDQFSLTIEAVKGGMGYALLPLYLIEAEVARGELTVVLDIPYATEMAYYIVTPEGRDAKTAAFRDWLLTQVRGRR